MRRSIKILTGVALTAGLVVGGTAYAKHEYRSPERQVAMVISVVSEELDLNATQKQALVALKDEVLVARELMQEQMNPTKDELVAMLVADSFDQNRALEIISSKTTALNQTAPAVIAALGDFLDGLDSEQKAAIKKFKEHKKGHHGHRFDHD